MPTAAEHQEKVESHLKFLQQIGDEFPDWLAIVAFYAAVELVEKLLAKHGHHSDDHFQRKKCSKRFHPNRQLNDAYFDLYNASLAARVLAALKLPEAQRGPRDAHRQTASAYSAVRRLARLSNGGERITATRNEAQARADLAELSYACISDGGAFNTNMLQSGQALRNRNKPSSVTCVPQRFMHSRFLISCKWTSPASVTAVSANPSHLRSVNVLRLDSAASVTCVSPKLSSQRRLRPRSFATPASVIAVEYRSRCRSA